MRASSQACFISDTLALLTLTSSLSAEVTAVAKRPDIAVVVDVAAAESVSSISGVVLVSDTPLPGADVDFLVRAGISVRGRAGGRGVI